ncbi:DUF2642 domain-containing protein [Priestia aryabhattai]|uniref:DUF2642 domain-containing protein n=1 Tax=Priestia aryabhattai TaxID=412384 RepID=UPI0037356755
MAPLTKQDRLDLLRRILQTTQDLTTTDSTANPNLDLAINLPGIDLDLNLGTGTTPSTSMRSTLLGMLDKQVVVQTTSGDPEQGALVHVGNDYITLIDATTGGTLSFVRIAKIEGVQEIEI